MTDETLPSDVFGTILVEHPEYIRIVQKVKFAVDQHDKGKRTLPCIPVYGHPGAGKTTVSRYIARTMPVVKDGSVHEHPDGTRTVADRVPVLCVEMPEKVSVTNVCREMLRALGDEAWSKGKPAEVPHRVDQLLKACRTKVVLIDEAQRVVDRAGVLTGESVVDALKARHAKNRVALFAFGLPRMRSLFDQDGQFYRRWDAGIHIKPYRWEEGAPEPKDRWAFMGLLQAFREQSPIPFDDAIDVVGRDEDMAKRIYYASRGLAGGVYKLLEAAARILEEERFDAVEDPTLTVRPWLIDLRLLRDAFDMAFEQDRQMEMLINPFGPDWDGRLPPLIRDENLVTMQAKRNRTASKRARSGKPTQRQVRADLDAALSKR